jgi:outer membrane protein assembly factor BamB
VSISSDDKPTKSPVWLVIGIPIASGLALSCLICLVKWLSEDSARFFFIGLDGMRGLLGAAAFFSFVIVVALIKLRLPIRTLMSMIGVAIITICGLSQLVRVESYNGDRTPRFTWRWTPNAEQDVKSYLASNRSKTALNLGQELFETTAHDCNGLLGPNRNGSFQGIQLADNWRDSSPRLLWRHPIGIGWSGFAVVGHAAVNLEQREDQECVVCYDARTGTELWCYGETTRFTNEHGDGPRSTPTIQDRRVVSLGATGILTCIDLETGALHWSKSVFEISAKQNLLFGMTGSPLVFDDKVVVTPGAGIGSSILCYSLATGEELWRGGDDPASYASPSLAEIAGHRQILSFNGSGLRSYSLKGSPLWFEPWVTQGESRVNVAQPLVVKHYFDNDSETSNTHVLISSGYDKGTALLNVAQRNGEWKCEVLWTSHQLKSKLSNILVHEGYVYGLDNGLLTCLNLTDGKRAWKQGRYGHGKLLLVGDKLLILAESGELVLVAADSASHRELGRFQALDSKTWNYFSLSGNVVLLRNDREAAAYELPVNDSLSRTRRERYTAVEVP